jgi:hypothetical protein
MKAFPNIKYISAENAYKYSETGMDLRDYFAAKALQGILACDYSVDEEPAVLAYQYANAMMEARNV